MESESAPTPQQVLDRLLARFRTGRQEEQLSALNEISQLNYSSAAILAEIEKLVLSSQEPALVEAALRALDTPVHRLVRERAAHLSQNQRQVILSELQAWKAQGIIDEKRAAILRSRYSFDLLQPLPGAPQRAESRQVPASPPSSPIASVPPAPRPTLTQTLLSETSIKIALYLGAFLVIAAAAILAALVEAARLPILAAVTLAFGAGAALTRIRLPQPGFVLFIVFSCLIPFDAAVLKDTLRLVEPASHLYWAAVYFLLVLVWSLAARFFSSRFFSVAAFIALNISLGYLVTYFDVEPEHAAVIFALPGLLALGVINFLKRSPNPKFGIPLFITSLAQTFLLALFILIANLLRSAELNGDGYMRSVWLFASLAWVLVAAWFFLADRLYPFPLFPWIAVLYLLPLPWTFLHFFQPGEFAYILAFTLWGTLYAASSELLRKTQNPQLVRWHAPLLYLSYAGFLIAWIWAGYESITYEFGVALFVGFLFALPAAVRPLRWQVWSTSLLAALAAFLLFFQLPFMERFDIGIEYPLAAAALLLFLPDIFHNADFTVDPAFRLPPRVLSVLLAFASLLNLAVQRFDSSLHRSILLLLFALVALVYALRYKRDWITYIFAAMLSLSVLEVLSYFEAPRWLPYMILLSSLYYLAGTLIPGYMSAALRNSGLALSGLSIIFAISLPGNEEAGWYSLLTAALFAFELYRFRQGITEPGIYLFTSLACWLILAQVDVRQVGYSLLCATAIWVLLPLLVARTYPEDRPTATLTNLLAISIALITSAVLLFSDTRVAALGFSVLTLILLLNALLRHSPRLGYSATASLPLAVIFILRDLDLERWLFPLITIAVLYYLLGFMKRRRSPAPAFAASWEQTLVFSGLALASLVSISAPSEGSGLQAAIPVAIAAVLWTLEAFELGNVWLGFPSNALYLMSYFMILAELDVEEPQFYSVGAAALGLLMHYLLTRSGSRTGAFLTGMLSQLVLLSTTYIQMLTTEELGFFAVLFFQGLAVLTYGIIIRSRSLVITPIIFVVLGVTTVIYSALKGISTVILIGCTGILLLLLGIFAVILRERFVRISERFSDWQA